MTKKGFTLAEVLITLTIIGVVASLTIPTLVNNIGDQQNKTAWKKAFADLSQATMMIVNENGGSLVGVFPGDKAGSDSLKNSFASKLNAIKLCSGTSLWGGSGSGVSSEGCWHSNNSWYYLNGNPITKMDYPGLILNNGGLMYFAIDKSDCSYPVGNIKRCADIYIDINGFKQPNTIGKDIFGASLTANSLIPWGGASNGSPLTGCTEDSTASNNYGFNCSAKYLYQ